MRSSVAILEVGPAPVKIACLPFGGRIVTRHAQLGGGPASFNPDLAVGNAQLTLLGISAGVAYFRAVAGSTFGDPILTYGVNAERVELHPMRFKGWTLRRRREMMVGVHILVGAALIFTGVRDRI